MGKFKDLPPELKYYILKHTDYKTLRNYRLTHNDPDNKLSLELLLHAYVKEYIQIVGNGNPDVALIEASKNDKNLKVVRSLINDFGATPSFQEKHAVFYSITFGNLDILKELLKHPASYDVQTIFYAIYSGNLEILKELLTHQPIKAMVHPYHISLCISTRFESNLKQLMIRELLQHLSSPIDSTYTGLYTYIPYGAVRILTTSSILKSACFKGQREVVQELLSDRRFDPNTFDSDDFYHLMSRNETILEELIKDPRFDVSFNSDYIFRLSCGMGKINLVKKLLNDKRVDPNNNDNVAFVRACLNGKSEVVHELLKDPRVDPTVYGNHALKYASKAGHLNVVQELLRDGRIDPSANNAVAVRWARQNEHYKIVSELMKDPRIKNIAIK